MKTITAHDLLRKTAAAFALGSAIGAPLGMASAKSSDHRDFEGTVQHISSGNIKVSGIEGGRAQTLSFLLSPKIKLSRHGNSPARLRDIHVGDMVKVRFDQKFLGVRHADLIIDETDGAHKKT